MWTLSFPFHVSSAQNSASPVRPIYQLHRLTTPTNNNQEGDGREEGDDEDEREKERRLATAKMFAAMSMFFTLLYVFFAEQANEGRRTLQQGPARYEGPVSWKEFYSKMLMAGEVESIEVVSLNEGNGSVARVYLYPDAVYNGMRYRRSYFSLDTRLVAEHPRLTAPC